MKAPEPDRMARVLDLLEKLDRIQQFNPAKHAELMTLLAQLVAESERERAA